MTSSTFSEIVKTWKHSNLTCVVRHGIFNCPCGYVKLPEDHPLYGVNYTEYSDCVDIDVHGGVTFSGNMVGMDGWFVGFGMAHFEDFDPHDWKRNIRAVEECERETDRLADQLADMYIKYYAGNKDVHKLFNFVTGKQS